MSIAQRQSQSDVGDSPRWARTELVEPEAHLIIEESIPNLANVVLVKQRKPGLEYLDYRGPTVPS